MAAIIFDFDGTIADSRDYFINFIAKEADLYPLVKDQQDKLHGLPLIAIARALGFSWWQMPNLYFKGRREMDKAIRDLKPFKGIGDVIRKLHSEGHELFIVSSNSVRNIHIFLKHNHLQEYFVEIYGGVEMFGKAAMLHQLLRENNLKIEQAIAVGDETRDIEAAKAVGMRAVAVTWGFARESDLKAIRPNAMIDTPTELLAKLEMI
jgi:phosphoglycolate phosphatase